MNLITTPDLRWDPYFMRCDADFDKFWNDYLQKDERHVLYVLGQGFDPRMCNGIHVVLNAGGKGIRKCLLIEFDEGSDSPSQQYSDLVSANLSTLNDLLGKRGNLSNKTVQMWSGDRSGRHRVGSLNAAGVFLNTCDFESYTDIVIDISAMPRGIYSPLIGKVLYLLDNARRTKERKLIPNLHVVVCEDASLDKKIRDAGIDDKASYIHGFGGEVEMEATGEIPKVWIPILGENQSDQLVSIYTFVNPDEICPVLPSPSLNPRRGDDLLIEYRELLFDRWRIEPKNIIYATEINPFETYRQIHRTVRYYNQALGPLGGCKAVVSALSSKLLSIGALLATYEAKEKGMRVGLAHVEVQGYEMDKGAEVRNVNSKGTLFTLWLAGDCYES